MFTLPHDSNFHLQEFSLMNAPFFCVYRSNLTTVMPDGNAYWATYEKISEYNVHLNMFERLWAACLYSLSPFSRWLETNGHG